MTKGKPALNPSSESAKIFQRLTPSGPPPKPVEKKWYQSEVTEDPLKKLNDDLVKKIAISQRIKDARASGAITEDQAEEMRIAAGLQSAEKEDEKEDNLTEMLPMLQLLKEAKTPEERTMIIQGMMSKKGGSNNNLMLLATMMQNNGPKEKSIMERYFEEKLMKELDGGNKKSEIETFREMLTTMKEFNGLTNNSGPETGVGGVDSVKKWIEALSDLGVVQKPTGGLEEMKLDLELRKLDLDKELRLEEIKGKSENDKMIANAIKTGATALVTALPEILGGRGAGTPEQKQQTPPPTGRGINCIEESCKTFLPVKLDQQYQFSCPKCGKHYMSQGDGTTVNEIEVNKKQEEEEDG